MPSYSQQVAGSQRLLAAEPLHGARTATTVRVRNGEVTLFDGPFAETKEMLAGPYLVEAKDLNEAIQLAVGIRRHGTAASKSDPCASCNFRPAPDAQGRSLTNTVSRP